MKITMDNIYLPTGNEQISIPTLYTDGRIEDINFLSMRYRGLIEIKGGDTPLMTPVLRVNGREVVRDFSWEREAYWIPKFEKKEEDISWSGEVCAPVGERGFYYLLNVKNNTEQVLDIEFGLEGSWGNTLHTINESKVMRGIPLVFESGWNHSLVFEFMGEAPLFSFAPMTDKELNRVSWEGTQYSLFKGMELEPYGETSLCFYWGIGLEEVGAATSAKEMFRKGWQVLRGNTLDWLMERVHTTGDERLDEVLNLNAFFNYFYATGVTLDTEEEVLVTSRSSRYYVSASYWDRDSLLWSLPSVLVMDSKKAKSMLDYVFTVQRRNIGIHSRYIDGVVLEPGFELDELCAPVLGLDMYLRHTGDFEYLSDPFVRKALAEIVVKLEEHRHSDVELYDTFLQPTDDPIIYPYLAYDNVLVWKVFSILSEYAKRDDVKKSRYFADKAESVKKAIYDHLVIDYMGKNIFAWAVDLEGSFVVSDEPPGSLQLLPYYGFCDGEDEVYRNTVNAIRSSDNEYSFNGYAFDELGCAHADHPWVLSIANSFLVGNREHARDLILSAPMDGGIACESIDENTGVAVTGDHFATCAGFLAYAIYYAYGKDGNHG